MFLGLMPTVERVNRLVCEHYVNRTFPWWRWMHPDVWAKAQSGLCAVVFCRARGLRAYQFYDWEAAFGGGPKRRDVAGCEAAWSLACFKP